MGQSASTSAVTPPRKRSSRQAVPTSGGSQRKTISSTSRKSETLALRAIVERKPDGGATSTSTSRHSRRESRTLSGGGRGRVVDEPAEFEGLRIRIGGAKRLSRTSAVPLYVGPTLVPDSHGSSDHTHEWYKAEAAAAAAASKARPQPSIPLYRTTSVPIAPPRRHPFLPPPNPPPTARSYPLPDPAVLQPGRPPLQTYTELPGSASAPNLAQRSTSPLPPASRWSPSSAGESSPLPAQPRPNFRNLTSSSILPHSNRNSYHSNRNSYRLSRTFSCIKNDSPTSSRSPKGFGISSFRIGSQKKKKRSIVIVSAQRVGSGRYTVMKETALRASALRKDSVLSMGEERVGGSAGSRRGSEAAGGKRRGSGNERPGSSDSKSTTRRRSSGNSERRGSGVRRGGSARSDGEASRRPSSIGAFDADGLTSPPDSMYRAKREEHTKLEEGPWVDLETPPPSPPKPQLGRSLSTTRLLSFIAASPSLTCPEAPPIEAILSQGRSLSAARAAALPANHPANHYARFRAFNDKLAAAPLSDVSPVIPAGPVPPPRRPSLAPTVDGSEDYAPIPPRKLSSFRLSIAEPREEKDETRRGSEVSWTASYRSRGSREFEAPLVDGSRHGSLAGSRQGFALSLTPNDRSAGSSSFSSAPFAPFAHARNDSASFSRNNARTASFPRSVSLLSTAAPPTRDSRLNSIVSAYSAGADSALDPIRRGEGMSWGAYSIVDSARGNPPSVAEIAPETLAPAIRRPLGPPPPLDLATMPFRVSTVSDSSSPTSPPPTTDSTQSSSSFTSMGTEEIMFKTRISRADRLSSTSGKIATLESLFNIIQLELADPEPSVGSLDVSAPTSRSKSTLTLDDLLAGQGVDDSWESSSRETSGRSKDDTLPPPYPGATPTLGSNLARKPSSQFSNFIPEKRPPPTTALPPLPSSAPAALAHLHLDFKEFRMQPAETVRTRPPSVLSPLSQPLITGFFFNPDAESELGEVNISILTPGTEAQETFLGPVPIPTPEVGRTLKNFDFSVPESPLLSPGRCCPLTGASSVSGPVSRANSTKLAPLPPLPHEAAADFSPWKLPELEPASASLEVAWRKSLQDSTPARPSRQRAPSQRRETHPADAPPRRFVRPGLLEADLMAREGKGRQMVGPDAPARLGSPSKRGFDKDDIRGWLMTARRDSVFSLSGGV